MSASDFGPGQALAPFAMERSTPLVLTPEARALWEVFAIARQQAEDSLLSVDGLAAAQAFWNFVEGFMPQIYGANVVPLNLRREKP